MRETTICYIEKNDKYLMMHRTKKKNDPSKNKWIGVGGKIEKNESKEECLLREVLEETGLELVKYQFRGKMYFYSDIYEDEIMYLYTSKDFTGELIECDEGELEWVRKSDILSLNLWEGDKVFLKRLLEEDNTPFLLHMYYRGDELIKVEEDLIK